MAFSAMDLKRHFKARTQAELLQELSFLYQNFTQVAEYYTAKFAGDADILKKYQDIIAKEFLSSHSYLPKAQFSVARQALNDFKRVCKDPAANVNLMLHYAYCVVSFNSEFGPDAEEFYTRPENVFDQALKLAQKHQLLERFKNQAHDIVSMATEGWGHQDTLSASYSDYYQEPLVR